MKAPKVNLFINFYVDGDAERQIELDTCLLSNLHNDEIDRVIIFLGESEIYLLDSLLKDSKDLQKKVIKKVLDRRPIFNDYFKVTAPYTSDINILSNTDIIIDYYSVKKLKNWDFRNYCLALTRWDILDKSLNLSTAQFFNRPDSQDTWIMKGDFPVISEACFTMGIAGCDNKIAYLLEQHKRVINPSREIKTYHLHLTPVRHYITATHIVRLTPPYNLIQPTYLDV